MTGSWKLSSLPTNSSSCFFFPDVTLKLKLGYLKECKILVGCELELELHLRRRWFEMTLNHQVIVERYPFMNGVVGGSISRYEIFSLLDKMKNQIKNFKTFYQLSEYIHLVSQVCLGSQEPTHHKVGNKPTCTKGILE